MLVDLHCHTLASDGSLSVAELIERAVDRGVDRLAITDHDTIEGYLQAKTIIASTPLELISGVEFSTVWGKLGVHIVGLHFDETHPQLLAGVEHQQRARQVRAQLIADKLERLGFKNAYEGAQQYAQGSQLGRPHFARFLVEQGYVKSIQQAFKRFLGAGKPGDVKAVWPPMTEIIQWINLSGGVAVLAHPLHYKMTATKLRALINDFKAAGGAAIEVVSGVQPNDKTRYLTELANRFDLAASCGSDFHHPQAAWSDLGKLSVLPANATPVWDLWD